MSVTKKLLVVFLALMLVMSSAFLSCAKELSAQEITTNAVSACPEIDTFRMDMNITADIEVIGGNEPGRFTMLENLTGSVNLPSTEMQMTGNVNIDIPGAGKQDISMGMYIVNGWMYMRIGLPQGGEQWMKMKLNNELWTAQNQLSQQIEFLKTAIEVTLLGSEKVDSVDCYVLQIKPNMEALTKWVLSQQQQQSGIGGIDLSKLDLAKLFKTISIKEWIAKDTYPPL
jgi:outer membrane lipoprotein-sorting protein